jgi:hypothetical protein
LFYTPEGYYAGESDAVAVYKQLEKTGALEPLLDEEERQSHLASYHRPSLILDRLHGDYRASLETGEKIENKKQQVRDELAVKESLSLTAAQTRLLE